MAAVLMAPGDALPRAWMGTRAHPRATVRTAAVCLNRADRPPQPSDRPPMRTHSIGMPRRRPAEAESSFELQQVGHRIGQVGTGHRQVWSYRDPCAGPVQHALCPIPTAQRPTSLSVYPPWRAQMSAARRACGRAELALRHRCFGSDRARLYTYPYPTPTPTPTPTPN